MMAGPGFSFFLYLFFLFICWVGADSSFNEIRIHRDKHTSFYAYLREKEDPHTHGIVVLPELFFINDEIKKHVIDITESEPGFKALIPRLIRGELILNVIAVERWVESLLNNPWGVVNDLTASSSFLKEHGSQEVGIVAYSNGVPLSLTKAGLVPGIVAFNKTLLPASVLAKASNALEIHLNSPNRDNENIAWVSFLNILANILATIEK